MAVTTATKLIDASGTIQLGGFTVHRLGFGAMSLTGPGVWGDPRDRQVCHRILRRAVELGVDFIDTADSYGPMVSEPIIREALHPYPEGLVIATKAGFTRPGPDEWLPVGRPEYLRQQAEMSLRNLGVEQLDLFQLHRVDPKVPAEDQFGLLKELLDEGKVAAVGLSEVPVEHIERARAVVPIVSVQNRYNLADRRSQAVLEHCEREGIGFIPWSPIAEGSLNGSHPALAQVSDEIDATPAQVALAWLLAISPAMIPIPGTASLAHLVENCAAAGVRLSEDQVLRLTAAG